MKKILTIAMVLALSTSMSFAATSFGKSFKQAVKSDYQNTKNSYKKAIKTDLENAKKENTAVSQAKKDEKLKQINTKLTELNKEMNTVKNQKDGITESERTLRMNLLQRQIDFYNKQKAALQ